MDKNYQWKKGKINLVAEREREREREREKYGVRSRRRDEDLCNKSSSRTNLPYFLNYNRLFFFKYIQ